MSSFFHSPGMRKWITRGTVASALILIVLLLAVWLQPSAPGIRMGKPLPPGKVKPQLVNAFLNAVLLAPDGSLWTWGFWELPSTNASKQYALSPVPVRIGSDSDWSQVACCRMHKVALKNDGSLWDWDADAEGETGRGNLTQHYGTPTRVGTETNWTHIRAGASHSLALKNDGSLWAWGDNGFSQLGDGTTNNRSVPVMIGPDRDWRTIAANDISSFALKSNGTIWSCGWFSGNWNLGGSNDSNVGNDFLPKQIGPDTNWLAISAHVSALLALKTDGTLWVTGMGAQRVAPAFASATTTNFAQIGWDSDWAEVYAGHSSFFARKKDGSWWVCGLNLAGQLGLGTNVASVPSPQRLPFDFEPWAFAPGTGTTLMLGQDGKLWTWGKRLGVKSSATRQRIQGLMTQLVERFPSLGFLVNSDIDQTPYLLWELPPEVRRSLGIRPNSATNNLGVGYPGQTGHE
jgi:alpha-tubulin suppressor-like RCC1 family protein